MSLLLASLIAFAVFLSIDKWLLPQLERFAFKSGYAEITRIGWIAGTAFVRRFALFSAITLSGFWLLAKGMSGLSWMFPQLSWLQEGMITFLVNTKTFINLSGGWKAGFSLSILGGIWLFLIAKRAQSDYIRLKMDMDGYVNRTEAAQKEMKIE